jgi:hypothetical protein
MNGAGYNGWTNRETWCVSLWLANEEGSYYAVNELARGLADTAEYDTADDLAYDLAPVLADYVTDMGPEEVTGLYADLLSSALQSVDWVEVAQGYAADAWNPPEPEEEEEEEEDTTADKCAEWARNTHDCDYGTGYAFGEWVVSEGYDLRYDSTGEVASECPPLWSQYVAEHTP